MSSPSNMVPEESWIPFVETAKVVLEGDAHGPILEMLRMPGVSTGGSGNLIKEQRTYRVAGPTKTLMVNLFLMQGHRGSDYGVMQYGDGPDRRMVTVSDLKNPNSAEFHELPESWKVSHPPSRKRETSNSTTDSEPEDAEHRNQRILESHWDVLISTCGKVLEREMDRGRIGAMKLIPTVTLPLERNGHLTLGRLYRVVDESGEYECLICNNITKEDRRHGSIMVPVGGSINVIRIPDIDSPESVRVGLPAPFS